MAVAVGAFGAAVAVSLGGGGLLGVHAAGGSDSTVVMIDPVRVLDTRDPVDVGLAGPFVSQVSQKLPVTGPVATTSGTVTAVPLGATGVMLNEIDITWDAYGEAGQTTDILIDVVGYTSDTKLAAIDVALAAKANSADIYTKAQIDASLTHTVIAAGAVRDGTADDDWVRIGTWSSSKVSSTGDYLVKVPAANPGADCVLPLVTLTSTRLTYVAADHFAVDCASGDFSFVVRTRPAIGGGSGFANGDFQFTVIVPPRLASTPAP